MLRTSSALNAVTSVRRGRASRRQPVRAAWRGQRAHRAAGRRGRGTPPSGSVICVRASAPTVGFGLASSTTPNRLAPARPCAWLRLRAAWLILSCPRLGGFVHGAARRVRSHGCEPARRSKLFASLRRASAVRAPAPHPFGCQRLGHRRRPGRRGSGEWPQPESAPERCWTGAGAAGAGVTRPSPCRWAHVSCFRPAPAGATMAEVLARDACSTPRQRQRLVQPTLNFFLPVFSSFQPFRCQFPGFQDDDGTSRSLEARRAKIPAFGTQPGPDAPHLPA